mmetsp:Transcript_22349/g.56490  ORF Transcript_22349/g.56490 Transcript_22349/m.56490 type:complete len:211 (-) Transcript_22349:700-1332(-)
MFFAAASTSSTAGRATARRFVLGRGSSNSSSTRLCQHLLASTPAPVVVAGSGPAGTSSLNKQHPNRLQHRVAPTAAPQIRYYHEAVIDHFNNPRNVGKLDAKKKNVGTALVGKASCGDVIKLQIEVDETSGKIKDAKFKTFGCGSAIASSSLATEMIINKDLSEAGKLKNTDISAELNLPPVKIHCSVLAEEAIQAAIEDYKKKQAGAEA